MNPNLSPDSALPAYVRNLLIALQRTTRSRNAYREAFLQAVEDLRRRERERARDARAYDSLLEEHRRVLAERQGERKGRAA